MMINGTESGTPSALAIYDSQLYVAGYFYTIDGDTVNHIARYSPGTGLRANNNVLGKEVMEITDVKSLNSVSFGHLLDGIYFYRLLVEKRVIANGKIIIQK